MGDKRRSVFSINRVYRSFLIKTTNIQGMTSKLYILSVFIRAMQTRIFDKGIVEKYPINFITMEMKYYACFANTVKICR